MSQYSTLPFLFDRPSFAYMNISLGNPPYIPPVNAPPDILNLMPVIVSGLIIEIQNKAASNYLRMFMYNQMSVNSYRNSDFDKLTRGTVDFILMLLANRSFPTPEAALNFTIEKMCMLFCGAIVYNYPSIRQYLDQNTINNAEILSAEYSNLGLEIERFKSNQQMVYGQRPQQFNRMAVSNVDQYSGGQLNSFVSTGGSKSNIGSKWASDVLQEKAQQSSLQQPFPIKEEINYVKTPGEFTRVNPGFVEELVSESTAVWKPIDYDKFYFPAHDVVTTQLFYRLDPAGKIIDVIRKRRDEPIMDEERHRINTVFGITPSKYVYADNNAVVNDMDTALSTAYTTVGTKKEVEFVNDDGITTKTFVDSVPSVERSLETAWANLEIARLMHTSEIVPDIYRTQVVVITYTISNTDDEVFLKMYCNASSFIALANIMKNTINNVGIEFWCKCNARMTALVNRLLKEDLAIPKISIDDFVQDIGELIVYLDTTHGSNIRNAFLRNQSNYISKCMMILDESYNYEDESNKLANRINGNEGNDGVEQTKAYITFLSTEYSLTYINITSFDLRIDLNDVVSARVDYEASPFLYSILDAMFSELDHRNDHFNKCLIKTKDGKIISCTRGLINPMSYMMTYVEDCILI